MKKLLLILAAIAYLAISCEDKPNTLTGGDEPKVDTSADTCKIAIISEPEVVTPIVMVYNTSSSNIDFEKSINSIFRNFTITLKNGSLDNAVCSNANCYDLHNFPSDSGFIIGAFQKRLFDSVKYGNYTIVMWQRMNGGCEWGKNHYDSLQTFMYHDITFDSQYTAYSLLIDLKLYKALKSSMPLTFTEF